MKEKTHEAYEEEIRMLKCDMENSFSQKIGLMEQVCFWKMYVRNVTYHMGRCSCQEYERLNAH